MKKSALIILAPGFEEIEAIVPIDLLRRAGISVTTAGLDSIYICGSHGVEIKVDQLLSSTMDILDAIILPGGGTGVHNLLSSDLVIDHTRNYYKAQKICAAICAAPLVFAKAGILKNHTFTTYPGCENDIHEGQYSTHPVVIDKPLITAHAAGAAIEFSLNIIDHLSGSKQRKQVQNAIKQK